MPFDVFISHAAQDKSVAAAVCSALEEQNIKCWIAPRDILPGASWGKAIIDGITNSRVMVLIFSSHSNQSGQVTREIERAVHRGIPVLPLKIENVLPSGDMEYFLSATQWLEAVEPPLRVHLQRLVKIIQEIIAPVRAEKVSGVQAVAERDEVSTGLSAKPSNEERREAVTRVQASLSNPHSIDDQKESPAGHLPDPSPPTGNRSASPVAEYLLEVITQDPDISAKKEAFKSLAALEKTDPTTVGDCYRTAQTFGSSLQGSQGETYDDSKVTNAALHGYRGEILEALHIRGGNLTGVLSTWLRAPDLTLRARAVEAIGKYQMYDFAKLLGNLLVQDESFLVRYQAITALRQMHKANPGAIREWYVEALKTAATDILRSADLMRSSWQNTFFNYFRDQLVETFVELGDVLGLLTQWLESPSHSLRGAAAGEVGKRKIIAAASKLAHIVQFDESFWVRSVALASLRQFYKYDRGAMDSWYKPTLIVCARQPKPSEAALKQFGSQGHHFADFRAALMQALGDP